MRAIIIIFFSCLLLGGCSNNNVTEDNSLKQYFDAAGVSGCFGMFDNGQGHFSIYNLPRYKDSAYLPAGTFDVVQSLVAIQTGVVNNDSSVIYRGDSSSTYSGPCTGTLHLRDAFRIGCTNAFQELARHIGKDTLKKWIDSIGYGNRSVGNAVDTFWLDNHLAVTADEQLGLVKKLYFDQLPFFATTQKRVTRMMEAESNTLYQLSYKRASGIRKDGRRLAWFIGWIQENNHPYFFVMNLDSADPAIDVENKGLEVLKAVLKQMGFFQGKK